MMTDRKYLVTTSVKYAMKFSERFRDKKSKTKDKKGTNGRRK